MKKFFFFAAVVWFLASAALESGENVINAYAAKIAAVEASI